MAWWGRCKESRLANDNSPIVAYMRGGDVRCRKHRGRQISNRPVWGVALAELTNGCDSSQLAALLGAEKPRSLVFVQMRGIVRKVQCGGQVDSTLECPCLVDDGFNKGPPLGGLRGIFAGRMHKRSIPSTSFPFSPSRKASQCPTCMATLTRTDCGIGKRRETSRPHRLEARGAEHAARCARTRV